MSKNSSKNNKIAGSNDERRIDEIFQALPPLGSDDYVAHISGANRRALPPEVLVRALRQLPPKSPAYTATLLRLLRQSGDTWDYFRPLMAEARRRAVGSHDYKDVLQDALGKILEVLPTKKGAFAEKAWHAFCRQQAIDAWRERFGRRGERLPKEDAVGAGEADDEEESVESPESVFEVEVLPPWHVELGNGNTERIEQTARVVVETIPDEFVREVANRAWFENMRPKISGKAKGDSVPLTELFPGKTRYQIQRALRQADAQLAAALLSHEEIDWSGEEQAFLNERIPLSSSAIRKEESR